MENNENKKVKVEDIIGIVKTDKPTNSVILKKSLYTPFLTDDRFISNVDNVDDTIIDIYEDGELLAYFILDDYTQEQVDIIIDKLNSLYNKFKRQEAISRQRRNEIITKAEYFLEKKHNCTDEKCKEVLSELADTSFNINEYVRKDSVLEVIEDYEREFMTDLGTVKELIMMLRDGDDL